MQKAGGNSMLALGIDPGTAICGYGVVEMKGSVMKPRLPRRAA